MQAKVGILLPSLHWRKDRSHHGVLTRKTQGLEAVSRDARDEEIYIPLFSEANCVSQDYSVPVRALEVVT